MYHFKLIYPMDTLMVISCRVVMNKRFLVWWLIVVVQFIGLGTAVYYGAIPFLLENDSTKLSFAIITMWFAATASVGYRSLKDRNDFETPWFIGEACMTVGM